MAQCILRLSGSHCAGFATTDDWLSPHFLEAISAVTDRGLGKPFYCSL